jgi:hypothetical protein
MGFTILDTVNFRGLQLTNLFITIHANISTQKRVYKNEQEEETHTSCLITVNVHWYANSEAPDQGTPPLLVERRTLELDQVPTSPFEAVYAVLKQPFSQTVDV